MTSKSCFRQKFRPETCFSAVLRVSFISGLLGNTAFSFILIVRRSSDHEVPSSAEKIEPIEAMKAIRVENALRQMNVQSRLSRYNLTRFAQYHQSFAEQCRIRHGPAYRLNRFENILAIKKRSVNYEQQARNLNQQGIDDQLSEYDEAIKDEKDKQVKAPWHREGVDEPPVRKQREAGAMTKGKLLTTPSRLLKLVLPLSTKDINTDRKDVAPLALLVHPQQPLSYLERLIQSELPPIHTDGGDKPPNVSFRAMESPDDEIKPKSGSTDIKGPNDPADPNIGEGATESYSGAGREAEGEDKGDFIRWSASTEIGDFIRDAARAKEFEVEIEGSPRTVKVAVPSFNDRTFYLRQRLRRTADKISDMAVVKRDCDRAAHKAGQRLALAGCGALVGYWYVVYRLTFETELGWDTMEPVTYLVGLSTLICGYLWFLYHNREVSYRSALNITISRRQSKLYEQRGFDLARWEALIEEGNALRKEIKAVAAEYDVEWDEQADEKDPRVTKALRDERKANKKSKKNKDDDDDDRDD